MKFVATKTADQFDLQALHRVRERLVSQRTGVVNQIRNFLLDRGVAIRQGLRVPRLALPPSANSGYQRSGSSHLFRKVSLAQGPQAHRVESSDLRNVPAAPRTCPQSCCADEGCSGNPACSSRRRSSRCLAKSRYRSLNMKPDMVRRGLLASASLTSFLAPCCRLRAMSAAAR